MLPSPEVFCLLGLVSVLTSKVYELCSRREKNNFPDACIGAWKAEFNGTRWRFARTSAAVAAVTVVLTGRSWVAMWLGAVVILLDVYVVMVRRAQQFEFAKRDERPGRI